VQPEDLRKRADNWVAAELRGGAAFLEDTLTDDFAGVGPRGVVLNWEQRPAPWVEGSTRLDYRPFALDRSEVRLYGGAAVATGAKRRLANARATTWKGSGARRQSARSGTAAVCLPAGMQAPSPLCPRTVALMTFGGPPSARLRYSAIPVYHKEEIHVEQTRHPDVFRWRQLQGLALVSRPRSIERSPCRC
jgi:hypothetical protein